MDDDKLARLNKMQRDIKDFTKRLEQLDILRRRADKWLTLRSAGDSVNVLTNNEDMDDVLSLIELKVRLTLAVLKDQYEEL